MVTFTSSCDNFKEIIYEFKLINLMMKNSTTIVSLLMYLIHMIFTHDLFISLILPSISSYPVYAIHDSHQHHPPILFSVKNPPLPQIIPTINFLPQTLHPSQTHEAAFRPTLAHHFFQ